MRTSKNEFFIDKAYSKYKSLSPKEKKIINFSLLFTLVVIATGNIYTAGKFFGEFFYHITN